MKQKNIIFIAVLLIVCLFQYNLISAQTSNNNKIRTVVIDPGHGGSDPGAVGKISKEKDLALDISLKFGKMIEDNFDDVEVIYTRTDDSFVKLRTRAKIANDNNADLFICIHINASSNTSPFGSETFVMGLHVNDANLEVAKLENSVILQEDDYEEQYDGFDPNDPENHIIFSLFQNANLNQSLFFADHIQNNLREDVKRKDRGVKQAGFLVLWKTTMPSVLVELGFISNREEEAYLNTDKGQAELAVALFDAFSEYKVNYEGSGAVETVYDDNANSNASNSVDNANTSNTTNNNSAIETNSEKGVFFKVQVMTSSQKIEINTEKFQSYQNVDVYLHTGVYKCTIGKEADYSKITELQKKLKSEFEGCFVVAFKNGERIPLNQARSELGQ